jgi:hypothetical protein
MEHDVSVGWSFICSVIAAAQRALAIRVPSLLNELGRALNYSQS